MPTLLTVTRTEDVTPVLRRIWFASEDLSAFADSPFTDRYVKLVFPKPGVVYPEPLDLRSLRGTIDPDDMPVVRTYTALFPDVERGTLAIDFVLHGDSGVAGPWAAAARPGDRLLANGPGGAYRPDPAADWHLFVGDESALPAITAGLSALPVDAVARVVAVVDDPHFEPSLPLPTGAEVRFAHRSSRPDGGEDGGGPEADGGRGVLAETVRALEWLPGRVQAFVHGEAHEVMHLIRPHLLRERGLHRDQVSISGYWRRGRTEEGFRAWKSDLAKAEQQP